MRTEQALLLVVAPPAAPTALSAAARSQPDFVESDSCGARGHHGGRRKSSLSDISTEHFITSTSTPGA